LGAELIAKNQSGATRAPRVLLAASEVIGFAKTGGLADVAGSLPRSLADRGVDVSVIMPLYRAARLGRTPVTPTETTLQVKMGWQTVTGRLWRSTLPDSNVPVWLVEQPDLFDRDDSAAKRGLYQYVDSHGAKVDYSDNGERFVFFCKAVVATLNHIGAMPDVVHCNDWQTGPLPALLQEAAASQGKIAPRTLFTVHNIAYQGWFGRNVFALTDLPDHLFNWRQLECQGQFNMLKAGLVFADWLNTVSPTYAREIQTSYYGNGLEGVLIERRHVLSGIVNGVDYRHWDPAIDPHITAKYTSATVAEGKAKCKAALQQRTGLAPNPGVPLLGVIARLVEQKGIELIVRAADALLAQDVQLAVLGEGDPHWQQEVSKLQHRYPQRVAALIGFDEALAHLIEAGADLFLMPSLYEPSGLNQLYSLRYGTVPIVRTTGGLADTIVDTTEETLANRTATGFRFAAHAPWALRETVEKALFVFRQRPAVWRQIQQTGMACDWSWSRSAAEYERLYRQLAGLRHG
jgi:starch synthase